MSVPIRPEHWRLLIANARTNEELFALACMASAELLSLYRDMPNPAAYVPLWTVADYKLWS